MLRISLDVINTFICFSKLQSTKATAEYLGITQPAVSQHLKQFEKFYQKPLFTFVGKKKTLTLFGQKLAKILTPHFDHIENALTITQKEFNDLSTQTLRIGARLGAIKKVSPFVIFPGALSYADMGSSDVISALIHNKIDYGLSRFAPDSLEIISKKVVDLPIHLLAHKALFHTKNYLDEFQSEKLWQSSPLYTYSEEIPYLSDWCKKKKISLKSLNVRTILNDWDIIKEMIKNNKGYTFCPAPSGKIDKNLISVPIPKQSIGSFQIYLLYSTATKALYPLEKCFNIEQLKGFQTKKGVI